MRVCVCHMLDDEWFYDKAQNRSSNNFHVFFLLSFGVYVHSSIIGHIRQHTRCAHPNKHRAWWIYLQHTRCLWSEQKKRGKALCIRYTPNTGLNFEWPILFLLPRRTKKECAIVEFILLTQWLLWIRSMCAFRIVILFGYMWHSCSIWMNFPCTFLPFLSLLLWLQFPSYSVPFVVGSVVLGDVWR